VAATSLYADERGFLFYFRLPPSAFGLLNMAGFLAFALMPEFALSRRLAEWVKSEG
jgi:hypothetical protein